MSYGQFDFSVNLGPTLIFVFLFLFIFCRYRESVIGACLNISQIDGRVVETNSRIMMKNLQGSLL